MDESHTGISIQQHLHAEADLVIALCGEALHHDRHRPRHIVTDVWTTDTFASLATEEARVVLTPDETAGVLIDWVVHRNITHITHTQERRNVGIIHQELVAETEYTPYYYATEKAAFEMDFMIQKGKNIVPIEVKAETNQKAKSLKAYCQKYEPEYAVRISMKNYQEEEWVTNLPLYAARTI